MEIDEHPTKQVATSAPPRHHAHAPHMLMSSRWGGANLRERGAMSDSSAVSRTSLLLRVHDACAAPASRLVLAAFHLHLAALRACCGCMALLAIMRRACMRRLHEPCEGAAGTYDLAADGAPPASSVASVIVSDAHGRVQPARSEPARIHYPFPPPATHRSCLPLRVSQDRIHRRRAHLRDRHRLLRHAGCGAEGVLRSTWRLRASERRCSPCLPQRAPASPYGQPRRRNRPAVARAIWRPPA